MRTVRHDPLFTPLASRIELLELDASGTGELRDEQEARTKLCGRVSDLR
jgi:hypothetical protein